MTLGKKRSMHACMYDAYVDMHWVNTCVSACAAYLNVLIIKYSMHETCIKLNKMIMFMSNEVHCACGL